MGANKSESRVSCFNQQCRVNRGGRQMREQTASVARAVTTLGSSSLHPSPSPPAGPVGHRWEEERPVLESSGGERCPTVRQDTPLRARLLERYHLRRADKREGNLWRFWIFNPKRTSDEKHRLKLRPKRHTTHLHCALRTLWTLKCLRPSWKCFSHPMSALGSHIPFPIREQSQCWVHETSIPFHIPTFQEVHFFFLLHYLHYTMAQYRAYVLGRT